MTRFPFRPLASVMLVSLAFSACTPTVPEPGGGVGFQDYNSYIRGATPAPQSGGPAATDPTSKLTGASHA